MLDKKTRRINYKLKIRQNSTLPLNGMHLNSPSTECWTSCRAASGLGTAWVDNACARSLAHWTILSIYGYDDTTSPHQTFQVMIYDCNTHFCLWYLNFIAISSFVCPKLACIELLISLHNDRHLFANGFVTVRPIAMNFLWDKESVWCLKFRKFCLNPTSFNRKLPRMFKLDFKKVMLTAFRTPVQNGLMQKFNIFCT